MGRNSSPRGGSSDHRRKAGIIAAGRFAKDKCFGRIGRCQKVKTPVVSSNRGFAWQPMPGSQKQGAGILPRMASAVQERCRCLPPLLQPSVPSSAISVKNDSTSAPPVIADKSTAANPAASKHGSNNGEKPIAATNRVPRAEPTIATGSVNTGGE